MHQISPKKVLDVVSTYGPTLNMIYMVGRATYRRWWLIKCIQPMPKCGPNGYICIPNSSSNLRKWLWAICNVVCYPSL